MPPSAAMAGSVAARRSRSSPVTNWRLISSPARRKNRVINPSLTRPWTSMSSCTTSPRCRTNGARRKRLVASLPGRVGPQERHAGGGQHDEPAGRLDSTEAQRWAHEGARDEAIRVPPAPAHRTARPQRRRGIRRPWRGAPGCPSPARPSRVDGHPRRNRGTRGGAGADSAGGAGIIGVGEHAHLRQVQTRQLVLRPRTDAALHDGVLDLEEGEGDPEDDRGDHDGRRAPGRRAGPSCP